MATVFWRGKQWIAQWYRPDGSRVKRATGCNKRREAERIAADMESKDRKAKGDTGLKFEEILSRATADAKAGKLSPDRASELMDELRAVTQPGFKTVSLADYLAGWIAEKKPRVKPSTHNAHNHAVRRFKAALGVAAMKSPIGDLTRAQVDSALRKIQAGGLRGTTVNLDLRIFRQAMKQALADGAIAKNPTDGIKPMPESDSTERAPFTAAEVRAMMDHPKTSDEWRGMILFGAHTGLRMGDVASLGREHVEGTELVIRPKKTDRSRKTIRIP
jgi:integrase